MWPSSGLYLDTLKLAVGIGGFIRITCNRLALVLGDGGLPLSHGLSQP